MQKAQFVPNNNHFCKNIQMNCTLADFLMSICLYFMLIVAAHPIREMQTLLLLLFPLACSYKFCTMCREFRLRSKLRVRHIIMHLWWRRLSTWKHAEMKPYKHNHCTFWAWALSSPPKKMAKLSHTKIFKLPFFEARKSCRPVIHTAFIAHILILAFISSPKSLYKWKIQSGKFFYDFWNWRLFIH